MDELRPITDEDAVYQFAAFAFHHPATMASGLWVSLLSVWPCRKGPRPNYHDANHAAQAVDRLGASLGDVASAWVIEPDSARKKVADGRKRFAWQSIDHPSILIVEDQEAAALLDAPPQGIGLIPDDPDRPDAWNATLLPTGYNEKQSREALKRASLAIRGRPGRGEHRETAVHRLARPVSGSASFPT